MDNNVPETLCKAFAHAGYYVVRFNFRGVGKSKGRCTCRASGERKDVLKIVSYEIETQWVTNTIMLWNVRHFL